MGRPNALEPDEHTLSQIKALRANQLTKKEAAAVMGVADSTFRSFLKDYPEAEEAWEQGKHLGRAALRRRVYQTALAGEPSMLRFVAKNWLGMDAEEKQQVSIDDKRPASRAEAIQRIQELMQKLNMQAPTNPSGTTDKKRLAVDQNRG